MNYLIQITRILFLFILSFQSFGQNADIELLRTINLNRNIHLDPVFKTFSASTVYVSYGIPFSLVGISLLRRDSSQLKKGIIMLGSVVVAQSFSYGLKSIIERDRPNVSYPEIENKIESNSSSFPSGHTTAIFAFATSLSLQYPKWYIISSSYLWASAVAYSRMHLGVHYPSDVLVGAILGSGTSYCSYKISKWLNKNKKRKIG